MRAVQSHCLESIECLKQAIEEWKEEVEKQKDETEAVQCKVDAMKTKWETERSSKALLEVEAEEARGRIREMKGGGAWSRSAAVEKLKEMLRTAREERGRTPPTSRRRLKS